MLSRHRAAAFDDVLVGIAQDLGSHRFLLVSHRQLPQAARRSAGRSTKARIAIRAP